MNILNKTLLNEYLIFIEVEKGLRKETLAAYKSDLLLFFKFLENKSIGDITILEYQEFLKYKIEKIKLKNKSIARLISSIKNFFLYLEDEGYLENSFIHQIQPFKIENHFPDYLTLSEVKKIINLDEKTKNQARDQLLLNLLYSCGLRVSEIIALTLKDINFTENFILVKGKGGKNRFVPVYPRLTLKIKDYCQTTRTLYYQYQLTDYLFLNKNGGKLSRVSLWKILKRRAKKVEIKRNIFPHTLRHSFATHMIQNGMDIRFVQELLGHEKLKTTEIYTHLSSSKLKEELKRYHPLYDTSSMSDFK